MNITELELKKSIRDVKERVRYLYNSIEGCNIEKYSDDMVSTFNNLSDCFYLNRRIETYTNWLFKGEMNNEKQYTYDIRTDKQYNESERVKRLTFKGERNTESQEEAQVERLKTHGIQYKLNVIAITPSLIKEDSELGEVLRQYQPLRQLLSQELQNIKNGQPTRQITIEKDGELIEVPLSFKMVREHIGEVNADMKLSIAKLKGLECNRPVPTKVYVNKLEMIDYANWKHVKNIIRHIYLKETSMNLDDIIFVADVNRAVKELKLSELDSDIIDKYNEGWMTKEIGKKVGLNHSNVVRRIDKVCKLISEYLTKNNKK